MSTSSSHFGRQSRLRLARSYQEKQLLWDHLSADKSPRWETSLFWSVIGWKWRRAAWNATKPDACMLIKELKTRLNRIEFFPRIGTSDGWRVVVGLVIDFVIFKKIIFKSESQCLCNFHNAIMSLQVEKKFANHVHQSTNKFVNRISAFSTRYNLSRVASSSGGCRVRRK